MREAVVGVRACAGGMPLSAPHPLPRPPPTHPPPLLAACHVEPGGGHAPGVWPKLSCAEGAREHF